MSPQLESSLIAPDQSAAVQRIMESNANYSLRVTGAATAPGSAEEVLRALPPGVEVSQKVDLGLWAGQELVAFADVIVGWPTAAEAHIGLLITHGARHGEGLGRTVHDVVVDLVGRNPRIQTLRLSIVDTNADLADPFWKKLGYEPTGEVKPYCSGGLESVARIWSRRVELAVDIGAD